MTEAERALLLAVAKTLRKCLVPEHAAYLYPYILAVEAEAVDTRALDEPCRSCTGHIRENNPERCQGCHPFDSQNYEKRVEAEAAPEAPAEGKSCETCVEYESVHDHECGRDDSMRYLDDFCDDYRHAETDVCPLCEGGKIAPNGYVCDNCNGTGKKEKK